MKDIENFTTLKRWEKVNNKTNIELILENNNLKIINLSNNTEECSIKGIFELKNLKNYNECSIKLFHSFPIKEEDILIGYKEKQKEEKDYRYISFPLINLMPNIWKNIDIPLIYYDINNTTFEIFFILNIPSGEYILVDSLKVKEKSYIIEAKEFIISELKEIFYNYERYFKNSIKLENKKGIKLKLLGITPFQNKKEIINFNIFKISEDFKNKKKESLLKVYKILSNILFKIDIFTKTEKEKYFWYENFINLSQINDNIKIIFDSEEDILLKKDYKDNEDYISFIIKCSIKVNIYGNLVKLKKE